MEIYKSSKGIKHWAAADRPREKLLLNGKGALSDAELLAIIIGSGSAEESAVELSRRILQSANNHLPQLSSLSTTELTRFKGIGEAKAISIVAAMELGRRYRAAQPLQLAKINCSQDAFNIIYPLLSDLLHELFYIALLNQANKVMSTEKISEGGTSATVVDIKKIMKEAILKQASSIILFHNHPSGNLTPSEEDQRITKQIVAAGKLMQIQVLDHLIIGKQTYFSFKDEGLM